MVFESATVRFADLFTDLRRGGDDGVIACRAVLDRSSATTFGVDFIEEMGVIPVELMVELSDRNSSVAISPATMGAVLFLENGTVLKPIDSMKLRDKLDRSQRQLFDSAVFASTFLEHDDAHRGRARGHMFFRVPKGAQIEGSWISTSSGDRVAYSVAIERSLLRFRYEDNAGTHNEIRTIHVGTE